MSDYMPKKGDMVMVSGHESMEGRLRRKFVVYHNCRYWCEEGGNTERLVDWSYCSPVKREAREWWIVDEKVYQSFTKVYQSFTIDSDEFEVVHVREVLDDD